MNKGGQFYIIAAIIIVMAISGIVSLSVVAVTRVKPLAVDELSKSLVEEGPQIIDYGIFTGQDITDLFDGFTDDTFGPYFYFKTENSDIIFIYGDRTELYTKKYNIQNIGSADILIGNNELKFPILTNVIVKTDITAQASGSDITVNIKERDYTFQLQDNQMFYFVMVQESDDETYVERN